MLNTILTVCGITIFWFFWALIGSALDNSEIITKKRQFSFYGFLSGVLFSLIFLK